MSKKKSIHDEVEKKLKEGRKALEGLRSRLEEAGHHTHDEVADALDAAEDMLDRGKSKLHGVKEASEDSFDVYWAKSKKGWHDLSRNIDSHWDDLSKRAKKLLG